MSHRSLEDLLGTVGSPVELLRNMQTGPIVYPGTPGEFTNWREEQRAWQESCALFNQTHHMVELVVQGPDALRLVTDLGVNSFEGYGAGLRGAKHFVACSPEGYVVGDVVLFALRDDDLSLVGRAPALNWVQFHAQTGGYDVTAEIDQRGALRSDGRRKTYRYQVQGPNAMDVLATALGQAPPDIRFFQMATVTIAGKPVHAVRHGMAGQPGWELFGPFDDGEAVHEALLRAGEAYGLRQAGSRTYSSNTLESGWIPCPLPAIYAGESTKAYREWLPAAGYEGTASLGGSFVSERIEDYYLTPWDLGYGNFVKFDHDFVGREALEELATREHRQKVTLALENEDVARTMAAMLQKEGRPKYMEWPSSVYSMHQYDRVLANDELVGISTWIGYSANEGRMLTLAMVDPAVAEPGTEVVLVWGEENGGTAKPTVEPHVQTELRAIVSPAPYVETVRKSYAPESWRAA